ncbi:MAG: TadE/TadG family type IV pilus assembly protein [Phototrophicaceae bacterium]
MRRRPKMGQLNAQKTKGQALVEFSLILPILLLVVLGIVDFGRILFMFSGASGSIRNATRQATLAGEILGVPRFMACNTINGLAGEFFLAGDSVQDIAILYFDTTSAARSNADIATALENLDITTQSTLDQADYDCDGTTTPPLPDASGINNGDLMVVLMDVEIEFITPFLSELFTDIRVEFRSQRTIVESLQLQTVADDRDGDGLDDQWEFENFGCVLENTQDQGTNTVYLMPNPDGTNTYFLAMETPGSPGWSYLSNTVGYQNNPVQVPQPYPAGNQPGTPIISSYSIFAGDDCARTSIPQSVLDDTAHPVDPFNTNGYNCDATIVDGSYQNCRVFATDLFNALDDPDGDDCVNGCEEANDINPQISDFDGDGLTDLEEITLGTDPKNPDTDGDNLTDGDEVNIYNTNPNEADSDFDGLDDDDEILVHLTNPSVGDTDGDGLADGFEINGFDLPNLRINGISDPRFGIVTSAVAGGDDTDGDGVSDFDEWNGYDVTYNVNGVLTTFTVYTHPLLLDTDGDGLNDGAERSLGDPTRVSDPTYTDTDGDGLNDFEETITYQTYADNTSSDDDQCLINVDPTNPLAVAGATDLSDFDEIFGAQAVAAGINPDGDTLPGGAARVNANDSDSDGDGLSDCDEVYIYDTNPYAADTDGGGLNDFEEVKPENYCRDTSVASDDTTPVTCGNTADTDGDGLPDGWETFYYPDITTVDQSSDTDNDNCNSACELSRGSNPINPDTDNDLIRDGYELGTSATDPDSDLDGLLDGQEGKNTLTNQCVDPTFNGGPPPPPGQPPRTCYATDPRVPDTDGDGLSDGREADPANLQYTNTNPILADTDGDGLSDGVEILGYVPTFQVRTFASSGALVDYNPSASRFYTDPNDADTDNDGLSDYREANASIYRTDPTNPDTDGDGVLDGTISGVHVGELGDDFNPGVVGYGTDPKLHDTDNDGLSDWQEINPTGTSFTYATIGTITINYIDAGGVSRTTSVTPAAVSATAFNGATMLNPLVADSDSDGLSDFEEIYPTSPNGVTNPLNYDSDFDDDGSGTLNDGNETNDGDPNTNPLDARPGGPVFPIDRDGDGLFDSTDNGVDLEDAGTSDTDTDTDNDGLNDFVEVTGLPSGSITFSYVYRNTSGTNQTVNATTANMLFALPTANTNNPFGYNRGLDSDEDGILDSFEVFWYRQTSSLLDTTGFVDFATSNTANPGIATCPWLTNRVGSVTNQPLDPTKSDTDGDGLWDSTECLDGGINANYDPFNGTDGVVITRYFSDTSLLVPMQLAMQGFYQRAYNAMPATSRDTSGRIRVRIPRTNNQLLITNLITTCGLASNGTTTANTCGSYIRSNGNLTNTQPNNNNGSNDDTIDIYIAPSVLFQYIRNENGSAALQVGTLTYGTP